MPFVSGLPETACGIGSTLARTEVLRTALPKLLGELGVRSILDAPCGDCNWISATDLSGIDYIGCDYDEAHLKAASVRMPAGRFILRDIFRDDLPKVDLILCREFMQHFDDSEISAVIRNFAASGSEWILATCYRNEENLGLVGGFRPVNLTRSPWGLAEPRVVADAEEHFLGLWHRSALNA